MAVRKLKSLIGIKETRFYENLEDISIFNFDKALTGNLNYIIVGYKGGDKKPVEGLKKAWDKLYNEFAELTSTNESIKINSLFCELLYLKQRYSIVHALVNRLGFVSDKRTFQEFCKELSAWGFFVDQTKPLTKELEKLKKQLAASLNKIDRKQADYDELTKDEKGEDKEGISLIEQRLKVKLILNIDVDLKTTSVIEWIKIWEEIDKMNQNAIKRNMKSNAK